MIGTEVRKGKEIQPEVDKVTMNDLQEKVNKATVNEGVANLMKMKTKVWRDLMEGRNEIPEEISEIIVNSVNTHPVMLALNNCLKFLKVIANEVKSFNEKLDEGVVVMMGIEKKGAVLNDIPEVNETVVNDLEGVADRMILMKEKMFKDYYEKKANQAEELAVSIVKSSDTDPMTKELYRGFLFLKDIEKQVNSANTQLDEILGVIGSWKKEE